MSMLSPERFSGYVTCSGWGCIPITSVRLRAIGSLCPKYGNVITKATCLSKGKVYIKTDFKRISTNPYRNEEQRIL